MRQFTAAKPKASEPGSYSSPLRVAIVSLQS